MKHDRFETLLALYAANQLDEAERAVVAAHLPTCTDCQADLILWQAVSEEIRIANGTLAAPQALAERALQQVRARKRLTATFLRAWQLLYSQALLVRREMWPVTASILALGVIVALVSGHVEFVYFIAPLVAAASLSMLSGPENDPAYELTVATSTSPWKVLLARLSIVSVYNLLLTLAALLALMFFSAPGLLGSLALGLFAPMAFLSALALLLSLWIGTSNAIAVTYALWIAQFAPFQLLGHWMASPVWEQINTAYRQFWQNPLLLFALSVLLLVSALWSANRPPFRLAQVIG